MNKCLFYLLSFTWSLPMTIVGFIVALVLRIAGYNPKKYGYCYYFEVGNNWGGFSVGLVVVTDTTPSTHTKNHEHGHALQSCYWGAFMPFVISIPSMIRYWYREYLVRVKKIPYSSLPVYDSAWFEGQATEWGDRFFEKLEDKNNTK